MGPEQLKHHIALGHRRLLVASAALTAAAALRAAILRVRRSSPRQVWGWVCAALCGSTTSAYFLALVKGLPVGWHVAVARLCESGLRTQQSGGACHVACRLQQYLAVLFMPRIDRPLFAEEVRRPSLPHLT